MHVISEIWIGAIILGELTWRTKISGGWLGRLSATQEAAMWIMDEENLKLTKNLNLVTRGWLRSEHKWSGLWLSPNCFTGQKISWLPCTNVKWNQGCQKRFDMLFSVNQQSKLLSLKEGKGQSRTFNILTQTWLKENWVGALRMKASKIEAPLDSSMSLEKSAGKEESNIKSWNNCSRKSPNRFGEQNGSVPLEGKNPPKRRGLLMKNPRFNGPRRVGL